MVRCGSTQAGRAYAPGHQEHIPQSLATWSHFQAESENLETAPSPVTQPDSCRGQAPGLWDPVPGGPASSFQVAMPRPSTQKHCCPAEGQTEQQWVSSLGSASSQSLAGDMIVGTGSSSGPFT